MAEVSFSVPPGVASAMREADNPHSLLVRFGPDRPLKLDAGVDLSPFQIAYQTYGQLKDSIFRSLPSATWSGRRQCCSITSGSTHYSQ